MSVDVRTRVDGPAEAVDPEAFFGHDLAEAAAAAAPRLAPAVRVLAPPPLTVACAGRRWVLRADAGAAGDRGGGRLTVDEARAGAGGESLTLTAEQLTDLVTDIATPIAWFSGGTLAADASIPHLLDWWVLLRAVLDGRTPHVPGAPLDGDGPVPAHRTFRADDPPEEMRAFLEGAGYLHVAGVFGEDEMAAVSADMDAAAPGYRRGDGRSWWAETADGAERLVRMQAFHEASTTVADLLGDDRLAALGALTGDGHSLDAYGGRSVEALVKPIGVVRGISDVPWHKDCSFGRHSYDCSSLTAGVSVTGAGPASGQLRAVAGSHRALVWPTFLRDDLDLPVVDLPTGTGDVTVHLSCTLHMSQPPVTRERRVLYTSFGLPPADRAAARAGRRAFRAARDAAPETVSQAPAV